MVYATKVLLHGRRKYKRSRFLKNYYRIHSETGLGKWVTSLEKGRE